MILKSMRPLFTLTALLFVFLVPYAPVGLTSPKRNERTHREDEPDIQRPGTRCASKKIAGPRCSRRGDTNNPPAVSLLALDDFITLACKSGTTPQDCPVSDARNIKLLFSALDKDGDTISFSVATTGGSVSTKAGQLVWYLSSGETAAVEAANLHSESFGRRRVWVHCSQFC
jgi:hypothetical protein